MKEENLIKSVLIKNISFLLEGNKLSKKNKRRKIFFLL
jgi:hypothetical protein